MKQKILNRRKDLFQCKINRLVAINPATVSGYAVWNKDGLSEWGKVRLGEEIPRLFYNSGGILVIEDQYSNEKIRNIHSMKVVIEVKGRWIGRAEDLDYRVEQVNPVQWQTGIGIPPFESTKREQIKKASKQYAEIVCGKKLDKGMQDVADAICIGETFIKKYYIEFTDLVYKLNYLNKASKSFTNFIKINNRMT